MFKPCQMKKPILLVVIVLFSFPAAEAQSWSLIKKDTVHYTTAASHSSHLHIFNSSTFGVTILKDKILNRNNFSTLVFKKDFSDMQTSSRCVTSSASILGDSIQMYADSMHLFIDSSVSVPWLWSRSSWLLYTDSMSNQVSVQLDSVVSVGADSLKYFSLAATASSASSLSHFDSTQIVISKNIGMIEGIDFSYFPDSLVKVQYFKTGAFTFRDLYDLEVGDEYHYGVQLKTFYNNFLILSDKHVVKITGKTMLTPDSMSLSMNVKVLDEFVVFGQGFPTTSSKTYQYNTSKLIDLNTIIEKGSFLDTNDLDSTGLGFYSDQFRLPTYVNAGSPHSYIYGMTGGLLCNNVFEHVSYTEYVFGIGSFYHTEDADMMGNEFYHENLVYYKKGSTTWGTPFSIVVGMDEVEADPIKMFPNPTSDLLRFENMKSSAVYEVYDLSGRKMKAGKIGAEEVSISLKDLPDGVYILHLQFPTKSLSKKIILR